MYIMLIEILYLRYVRTLPYTWQRKVFQPVVAAAAVSSHPSIYCHLSIYSYILVYGTFGLETRQHSISIYIFITIIYFVYGTFGLETRQHSISIYIPIYLPSCLWDVRLGNSPTSHKHIYTYLLT